ATGPGSTSPSTDPLSPTPFTARSPTFSARPADPHLSTGAQGYEAPPTQPGAIHPRRDPRHPVDARIRIRIGPADPARPPRRTAQDVPPTGGPGPALRGGGLRRGHHRAPRER